VIEIELKLYQALFGFSKVVEHLDGKKLFLQYTGKTEFGTVRKICGEGMKDLRTGIKGDLIIKFNIDLPTITNETLMKALTLMDKSESKREKSILTEENLVKTIMTDITTYKSNKNNKVSDDEESDDGNNSNEGPSECRQQ
jgi:DnaJ-class molecular chaperone